MTRHVTKQGHCCVKSRKKYFVLYASIFYDGIITIRVCRLDVVKFNRAHSPPSVEWGAGHEGDGK